MGNYVFVMPSFSLGAARAIDLGGTLDLGSYLYSDSPAQADSRGLAVDAEQIAQDAESAVEAINGQAASK